MQLRTPCDCGGNGAGSQLLCAIDWIFLAEVLELRLPYMRQPLILLYYTLVWLGLRSRGRTQWIVRVLIELVSGETVSISRDSPWVWGNIGTEKRSVFFDASSVTERRLGDGWRWKWRSRRRQKAKDGEGEMGKKSTRQLVQKCHLQNCHGFCFQSLT